ncbi:MAG: iron ABC transporter permease [Cohaesibacter sp.]|nr:iron ABC transporter permease [Cohaesibacter sp.]
MNEPVPQKGGSQTNHSKILQAHHQQQRRKHILLAILSCLAICLFIIDIFSGPSNLSISVLLNGLINPDSLTAIQKLIIFDMRLPAACLAALVGACLSVAGVEIQTILENPLASPFTLGISSAAAFGASLAIIAGLGVPLLSSQWMISANAFGFAILSMALLQGLAKLRDGSNQTLILFGIAMVFGFSALLSILQLFASAQAIQMIVFWTMGSVERANWSQVALLGGVFFLLFPLSIRAASALTALRFGTERAHALGIDVSRLRLIAQIRISLLTALAVALSGTIAFVGLVGPHLARLLVGENHKILLPASALSGAILMNSASIVSKLILPGVTIPIGIITALVGVPVFLSVILAKTKK